MRAKDSTWFGTLTFFVIVPPYNVVNYHCYLVVKMYEYPE